MSRYYPVHDTLKALLGTARNLNRLVGEEKWFLADLAECAGVNDRDARKRLTRYRKNSVARSKVGRIILNTKTDVVDFETFRL